jgi:hypothetical protein
MEDLARKSGDDVDRLPNLSGFAMTHQAIETIDDSVGSVTSFGGLGHWWREQSRGSRKRTAEVAIWSAIQRKRIISSRGMKIVRKVHVDEIGF